MPVHETFCRICIAACGMRVTVEGEQVVAVRGDPSHPLTRGYLCVKGRAAGELQHSPRRLTGAQIGRGADRRSVSIDEAHAHLAGVLHDTVANHGPGAIGVFHGTGAFQDALGSWTARRFKKVLGTNQLYSTATVDAVAKTLVAEQMAGTPLLIPNIDEELGRLLVFVGINPVISHGHATMFSDPIRRLREARARGRVVTLDPRRTETAGLSDQHLAVRPGTDYAVFGYVLRALLAGDGDVDIEALEQRATNVDGLRSAVARFDAAAVASLTGLTVGELDALVDAVRQAGRLAILSGTGSTMTAAGNVTEWLAWSLMVVTDSFDKPGGMWFNPGYFTRLDLLAGLPPAAASEPSPPSRPDIARCGGEWPATLIPDEIAAGRLRALIVLGSNLVTALPQPERVRAALEAIDTLVVLDVVDNATTDAATHLFACAAQFERADILPLELNANAVYQHYTDAVVPPRADRPPMWQTLGRIAAGLGLDALGSGIDPMDTTTEAMLARMARGDALARVREAGGLAIESGPVYDWVRSRIPAGRWNLAPSALLEQLDQLQQLARSGARPQLVLTPRRVMPRMNWQEYRAVDPGLLIHPDDAASVGVADGDRVIVDSGAGTIRLRAEYSPNVTRGAVSVVHGVESANVNELIDATDLDALTGMARLAGVAVSVRPA